MNVNQVYVFAQKVTSMTTRLHGSRSTSMRGIIVIFALLALAAVAGCQSRATAPEPPAEALQAVRTVQVRSMGLSQTLDYVGTIRHGREIKVLARVVGTLTALPFKEGASVRKRQVLARVSVPELDVRQQRLGADVQRLLTDRDYLCTNLETDVKLRASGAVSQAKVDASRRRCSSAREAVKAAQAGSRELESSRGKAVERAPFSGRVLRWYAEPGEHVARGRPILLLGDDALEVAVQVTETDLVRGVKAGSAVALTLIRPTTRLVARKHAARIRTVAPMASGPGRTVEVRIGLPAELRSAARHGASVDVAFVLAREEDAVAVPEAALSSSVSGATIFIVNKGRVTAMRIKAGITDEGWVAIKPPPPRGARVAVTNLDVLSDGMKVYPVQDRGGIK